jgi:hypothetical protein
MNIRRRHRRIFAPRDDKPCLSCPAQMLRRAFRCWAAETTARTVLFKEKLRLTILHQHTGVGVCPSTAKINTIHDPFGLYPTRVWWIEYKIDKTLNASA